MKCHPSVAGQKLPDIFYSFAFIELTSVLYIILLLSEITILINHVQYNKIRRSTVFLQMGHSDILSPHIWQVP